MNIWHGYWQKLFGKCGQFVPNIRFLHIKPFDHRHEEKSCSACRESVNERMRERDRESKRVRLLRIVMKTKVAQHVERD